MHRCICGSNTQHKHFASRASISRQATSQCKCTPASRAQSAGRPRCLNASALALLESGTCNSAQAGVVLSATYCAAAAAVWVATACAPKELLCMHALSHVNKLLSFCCVMLYAASGRQPALCSQRHVYCRRQLPPAAAAGPARLLLSCAPAAVDSCEQQLLQTACS